MAMVVLVVMTLAPCQHAVKLAAHRSELAPLISRTLRLHPQWITNWNDKPRNHRLRTGTTSRGERGRGRPRRRAGGVAVEPRVAEIPPDDALGGERALDEPRAPELLAEAEQGGGILEIAQRLDEHLGCHDCREPLDSKGCALPGEHLLAVERQRRAVARAHPRRLTKSRRELLQPSNLGSSRRPGPLFGAAPHVPRR